MGMGFLAMTATQLVEVVYLGIVGTDELAAISYTFPIVLTLNAAARGIGVGASAVIARAVGAGDRDRAALLATHCLVLVFAFSAVCTVLGITSAKALLATLGAEGHVLALADLYMRIWFSAFAFFAVSMVGTNLLRSVGNAAVPGMVMTLGSALQMALGPFLIFGWLGVPALGIAGAAAAFVIARFLSFLYCMYWIGSKEQMLVSRLRGFVGSSRSILHVGMPAMATNLIAPLSTGVLTRLLAGFGHAIVAGFGVASRVDAMMAMVVIAISSAVGPFVGQNWGARNFARVHEAMRLCYRLCLGWGFVSLLFMLIAGTWLVERVNNEPDVVAAATSYLMIVPFTAGFMGVMNVASGCFNALSRPTPPLVLSALRLVGVLVPLALLGRAYFGYVGIYLATGVANVLVGVLAWVWARRMLADAEVTVSRAGA
jgi:putative MATE family efflux protein